MDGSTSNSESSKVSMKVALGVSGGIAAYKAAEIVRLLQERGIRVQVIMTRAAQEFVRPLTFAALSGEKVITDMFAGGEGNTSGNVEPNIDSAVEHIAVAQSIDALLVAPATADVLAKFAPGSAETVAGSDDSYQNRCRLGLSPEIDSVPKNQAHWTNVA